MQHYCAIERNKEDPSLIRLHFPIHPSSEAQTHPLKTLSLLTEYSTEYSDSCTPSSFLYHRNYDYRKIVQKILCVVGERREDRQVGAKSRWLQVSARMVQVTEQNGADDSSLVTKVHLAAGCNYVCLYNKQCRQKRCRAPLMGKWEMAWQWQWRNGRMQQRNNLQKRYGIKNC